MTSPTDLPGTPDMPQGVSITRIAGLLVPDGWTLDGATGILRRRWPQLEIVITLQSTDGMLLLFRGSHVGEAIPLERRRAVEAFVNDWHRERIWPTVAVTTTEDAVAVQAHVGVDVTAGLTASQLDDYLRIGIGTTHQFFTTAAKTAILPSPPQADGASADPDAG